MKLVPPGGASARVGGGPAVKPVRKSDTRFTLYSAGAGRAPRGYSERSFGQPESRNEIDCKMVSSPLRTRIYAWEVHG